MFKHFYPIVLTTMLMVLFSLSSCTEKKPEIVNQEPEQKPVIIAYVHGLQENWGKGDQVAKKITHINYAFANVLDGKVVEGAPEDSMNMARLRQLKAVNPDLKILISVGGWSWSDNFSDAALTPESREIFAQSAVDFLQKHQLDGIDLDWEYPGQIGEDNVFRPEDKQNFTAILKLIREKLDTIAKNETHYLLTIATGANQKYLDHTEMDKASQYLDLVNIMTYDYIGPWSEKTGHHSNLFPSDTTTQRKRSSQTAVEEHLNAGIPADKLVLGVPFYGYKWIGVEQIDNGLYQNSVGERGSFSYAKIEAELIDQNGFKRYWDEAAKAPYLWQESTGTFVSYEDEESIGYKIDYLKEKEMRGIMFWQFNADSENHTLLNTIFDHL